MLEYMGSTAGRPREAHSLVPAGSEPARADLARLELIIERGLRTFVEVGRALLEIKEHGLYRSAGYRSFAEYTKRRWDISRSYAYRQIEAAQVVAVLEPLEDTPLPVSEAQARELARLAGEPETLRAVWRDAVATAGSRVTAQRLRRTVDARLRSVPSSALVDQPERAADDVGRCPTCGRSMSLEPSARVNGLQAPFACPSSRAEAVRRQPAG